jgi:hypothetical protein
VDPRTSPDDVERRKILYLLGLELRSLGVGSRHTECAIVAPPLYFISENWLLGSYTFLECSAPRFACNAIRGDAR